MITLSGRRRLAHQRLLLVLVTISLAVVTVLVVAQEPDRILAGDPPVYRLRVQAILSGGIPYLQVPFEHLPVMLVPMMAAWFLGGAAAQGLYVVIFAALMTVALAASGLVLDRLAHAVGDQMVAWRWMAMTVPLYPLLLFRNDPVVVLLAVLAIHGVFVGSSHWGLWAGTGALAKVWPAALAVAGWSRNRRSALVAGIAGVFGLGITLLPGFVEQRAAFGIHVETLSGSVLALVRTLFGDPSRIELTTAAYIHAPGWLNGLNAGVGLLVAVLGVGAVARREDLLGQVVSTGTITVGVILTSSLFSLQYVLWVVPFLALSRQRTATALGVALSLVTIVLAWVWSEPLLQEPWFHAGVTLRNGLVLTSAFVLAREDKPVVIS